MQPAKPLRHPLRFRPTAWVEERCEILPLEMACRPMINLALEDAGVSGREITPDDLPAIFKSLNSLFPLANTPEVSNISSGCITPDATPGSTPDEPRKSDGKGKQNSAGPHPA